MKDSKDVAKQVLGSKIVNYEALGKTIAKLGPELALMDDPWENFCGTMRYYIRIFRLAPFGSNVQELDRLERLEELDRQL
ncbi:hypothetical protein [Aureibaculum luteum]|uniref:hypothetical protein n=1 Tax=Aureibaculum luteum TaxID=1548456 RepID=UPI000E4AFDD8|nr:hypothetical protein [Aureibaculum luteum]